MAASESEQNPANMSRVFEALQQLNAVATEDTSRRPDVAADPSMLLGALAGEITLLEAAREFVIPSVPSARLVAISEPHTLAAEKLRGLAARFRQLKSRSQGNRILMASAVRGDGKSMMSANLAITLAAQGDRTLLIDGDLHKPTLHQLLGVRERRGLTDWTQQRTTAAEYFFREKHLPLWFLPAGNAIDQPLTSIQSPATKELLSSMKNWFDWIVIDSPPVVPLADSSVWSTMCDRLLFVVREGATPKKALMKAIEAVDKAKLCAVILNDAVTAESKYYRQYYTGSMKENAAIAGK